MKILGRQPALLIAVITSVILLLSTFGFRWLSGEQAGLIIAAISAGSAAVTAFFVRPIAPSVFSAFVGALAAVAAAYGFELSAETVAATNSVVITLLAFITYGNVSPIETSVTEASDNPTPEAAAHAAGG